MAETNHHQRLRPLQSVALVAVLTHMFRFAGIAEIDRPEELARNEGRSNSTGQDGRLSFLVRACGSTANMTIAHRQKWPRTGKPKMMLFSQSGSHPSHTHRENSMSPSPLYIGQRHAHLFDCTQDKDSYASPVATSSHHHPFHRQPVPARDRRRTPPCNGIDTCRDFRNGGSRECKITETHPHGSAARAAHVGITNNKKGNNK